MSVKSRNNTKKVNKNLRLIARFTVYSYSYVRQVACGMFQNDIIQDAIEAFNNEDFAALERIKTQRLAEVSPENPHHLPK